MVPTTEAGRRRLVAHGAAVIALVAASCGSDGPAATNAPPTSDRPAVTTTASDPGGEPNPAPVAVRDGVLGEILVDEQQMTLYISTEDGPNQPRCLEDCAQDWPPLLVEQAVLPEVDGLDGDFGRTERPDGTQQLTIAGQPLYYFAGDRLAGDVAGHGVAGSWFAVDPAGRARPDEGLGSGDGY